MKLTKISIVMLTAFSCASFANNYIMKVDTGNDELAEWTESSVTTTKWENLGELKDCSPNAFPSNKAIGDSYHHRTKSSVLLGRRWIVHHGVSHAS